MQVIGWLFIIAGVIVTFALLSRSGTEGVTQSGCSMWLFLIFLFPGILLIGIGAMILSSARKKAEGGKEEQEERLLPEDTQPEDAVDQIRKYSQLLQDGIITQEEFEEKKKKLLNL